MKFTICLLVLVAVFVNNHAFPGDTKDKVKDTAGKEKKVEDMGKQDVDKAKKEVGDLTQKGEGMMGHIMGGDKDDKKKPKDDDKKPKDDDKKPDSDKPKDGDDDKKKKKHNGKGKENKKDGMKKMMKPIETAEKGMETEMNDGIGMIEEEIDDCVGLFG